MLDKKLIKKNFEKSIETYFDNAIVQKKTAQKLIELLPCKKFDKILEIGCYSGILTDLINKNIDFKSYLALDIVDCEKYIKKINPKIDFKIEDVENFKTEEKYDLIIANASLQWSNDFISTIKKLRSFLSQKGILAFSVFEKNNLFEIKNAFSVSLNYPEIDDIKRILPNCKTEIQKEELKFSSSIEILRHLKLTGVNSILKNKLSYKEIKQGLKILEKQYKNTLTYYPLLVIYNH